MTKTEFFAAYWWWPTDEELEEENRKGLRRDAGRDLGWVIGRGTLWGLGGLAIMVVAIKYLCHLPWSWFLP